MTTKTAGTDVDVTRQALMAAGDIAAAPEFEDPEVVATEIVARILEAPDLAAVLDQGVAYHARDVLDQPFVLHGVKFNRSRLENGPGVFAILDAQFDDGRKPVTCGSRNVMAQAYRIGELGGFGVTVKIVEGSETAAGYRPMWLTAA